MKWLLLGISFSLSGFANLDESIQYASKRNEFQPIENQNVLQPSFKRFHKSLMPTRFTQFLEWTGLVKPLWSVNQLDTLLVDRKKEEVITLVPEAGTEIIVCGPLLSQ